MKLILTGLGILMVLIVWWGIGVFNGSFYYQMAIIGWMEYDDYTLIGALQAILVLALIGILLIRINCEK